MLPTPCLAQPSSAELVIVVAARSGYRSSIVDFVSHHGGETPSQASIGDSVYKVDVALTPGKQATRREAAII
jgi:hypothetical protein